MIKRNSHSVIAVVFSLIPFFSSAQVALKPHIGVDELPLDTDEICDYPIPVDPEMTFDSYPFFAEDTIADFTFYNLEDEAINMSELLEEGKPVILVSLSFSCPYVRNHVAIYNDIFESYSDELTIIGIYQLEAHPDDDYSPNNGAYGNLGANIAAGIVIDQHQTYLDRKIAAQDFIDYTGIAIPIYMDGPCNEWWENFSPGPATGYIIRPNGEVFVKHGWFDKAVNGHDIYCDIDSLLYDATCEIATLDGSFTLEMTTSDTVYGTVGEIIDVECDLINTSDADVLIEILRSENDLDLGWSTAICADICLDQATNSYEFILEAGATQHFYMHFYSDDFEPGTAHTRMVFRNAADFSNKYIKHFYAYSDLVGIDENNSTGIPIYPNPTLGQFIIDLPTNHKLSTLLIYNISGEMVKEINDFPTGQVSVNLAGLTNGVYYLELIGEASILGREKLILK